MKTIKNFGDFVNEELTAAQKKLPEGLRKSIEAKQGKKKDDDIKDEDKTKDKKEDKTKDKKEDKKEKK